VRINTAPNQSKPHGDVPVRGRLGGAGGGTLVVVVVVDP
jgi:hypothetical protein